MPNRILSPVFVCVELRFDNLSWHKWRQSPEPQACALRMRISELPWLNVLSRLAIDCRKDADRVLKTNTGDGTFKHSFKKNDGILSLLMPVRKAIFELRLEPLITRDSQVSARRMTDHHVPALVYDVKYASLVMRPGNIGG